MSTRLGAIYALARLGGDSSDDRGMAIETLAAFVRIKCEMPRGSTTEVLTACAPPQDVLAALAVLSLREGSQDDPVINLEATNLYGARLKGARFRGARLGRSCLRKADLTEADLTEADLTEAILTDAELQQASFKERSCRRN